MNLKDFNPYIIIKDDWLSLVMESGNRDLEISYATQGTKSSVYFSTYDQFSGEMYAGTATELLGVVNLLTWLQVGGLLVKEGLQFGDSTNVKGLLDSRNQKTRISVMQKNRTFERVTQAFLRMEKLGFTVEELANSKEEFRGLRSWFAGETLPGEASLTRLENLLADLSALE